MSVMKALKYVLRPLKPVLMPLKRFMDNILLLFKYNLEERFISTNINDYLDNLKYELEEDLENLKRPRIATPQETIEKIIKDRISIARFGDGEFELLNNRSIPFQRSDDKLAKRLKEVLTSDVENIAIGIPYIYWHSVKDCNATVKNFVRIRISTKRKEYEGYIDFRKQYIATEFTQLYMCYSDDVDMGGYFENVRRIWNDRDITIIQGDGITKYFKINIFDNAKSIEYIIAPAKNAFFEYDKILRSSLEIDKNRLVLIILGPTATILAYDLAQEGYQALDIGHTAKDYDFYNKGISKRDEGLNNFFSPD